MAKTKDNQSQKYIPSTKKHNAINKNNLYLIITYNTHPTKEIMVIVKSFIQSCHSNHTA